MRIGIREQLGLLVLLTTLVALAVVAVATWVNNYNFVIGIRTSSLTLTASLYANQLNSNLLLLQSSVTAISTRIALQTALQRYNEGNNTDANWVRAETDMQSALSGGGSADMLLEAMVISKNGSGTSGPYGLLNASNPDTMSSILLPITNSTGLPVYLGDNGTGYPVELYPNLTFTSTVVNDTFNRSNAFWEGESLYNNSTILLGPWLTNQSFALLSLTVPVVNDTSIDDNLGWLTIICSARSIFSITQSLEGLGNTGQILIVAPNTPDQKLPASIRGAGASEANRTEAKQQNVHFVLPPVQNASRSTRHPSRAYGMPNIPFEMQAYPAVLDAYTLNNGSPNNAGSLLSTNNEENKQVSVGYALPMSPMVNWALIVEQAHSEVIAPINHLRNVLVACVFGTVGVILLLLLPLAHFSVRPIRRLREATKKTVEPYRYESEDGERSTRSSSSDDVDGAQVSDEEEAMTTEAKKEGFMGRISQWRTGGRKRKRERRDRQQTFRIPAKVQDGKHVIHDELTDLTRTYNEMSEELMMQYERLEERVKERTMELEISKKAAEAANESKTAFIANISHELKTPLNGILGMTAVCMQEEDHTKIKRSLGIIYKSGDLLLHLLTDLLTFTKNQIGQNLTLDEREFRLADVCSQVVSIFEKQAKDGAITLGVTYQGPQDGMETASGAPLQTGFGPYGTGRVRDMFLWGDQHRILQVIINLVSNSLKFTPPNGSVNVRIRCVGDAPERAVSRKGSMQSKQSKQSKRPSPRGSRRFGRVTSDSGSSTTSGQRGRERAKYSDTALHINGSEPKAIPTVAVRERSSTPSPPPNARVLLFDFEVEDTGPGIPESQQQRVFEPFVQGDIGLNKKYGGTGLGLSICSQLASLMKGSMDLKSQEGVGSKFTMRIPLIFTKERADSTTGSSMNSRRNSINMAAPLDESHSPQRRSSTEASVEGETVPPGLNGFDTPAKPRLVGLSQPFFASTSPLEDPDKQLAAMERVAAQAARSGDKVRVLVAEDNKVNQEVVLRMLKLEDIYDVTVAKDGQEAFELVKESMEQRKFFNLIFMDVQMPNLDGIQSTRLIREMGYSAPIVALTAFAEESNVKECMDSGMDFFLPKPIRRPALKQVLKRYCATIPEAAEEPEKEARVPPPVDDAVSPMS
ncbi:osomolarity two-component system, sensor histidine kinase SLN1, partial [Lecanoromycetidae sp. Uapishka_2]